VVKKNVFAEGEIFHVFNKSIANYPILNDLDNSKRFYQALAYYNSPFNKTNLGNFLQGNNNFDLDILLPIETNFVKFISFCFMPDHYHLLIKVQIDRKFSKYMSDVENSFSRFFNIKFSRKGPLWQSRFKAIRIQTNEQLLHVSRYIHINPTTINLVKKPENWIYSSYNKIISYSKYLSKYLTEISIKSPSSYKKFVENNIDYQKKLAAIKKLTFD